ncbi:MAG: phage tail protein [Sphingomonas sp.]
MATVVLTVAGGLVGGPIGAAVGAALGNAFDRDVLFKPKGREGPRLTELRIQTSSYGTQIPRLFGTMRVAGSVIWATDLIEHRSTQSSGKGRPSTTSYSYTASFAVALSGRRILNVGRIWADGKLLRGGAGDFKVRTGFRLHLGSDDQAVDPLIAAAEGIRATPAHRGMAYAVFEDLDLAEFGNRIPSLTFEVTADTSVVEAGAIVRELSEGAIEGDDATPPLAGFSAYGASVRAAVETLAGATGSWFRAEPEHLTLLGGEDLAVVLEDAGMGSTSRRNARHARTIAAPDTAPRSMSLSYYEPGRDYQTGVQRAVRPGAGIREARLELAAAMDASAAKTLAEGALARFDLERERRTLALGWRALGVRPGERIMITGEPGTWRVDRWSLEAMVLTLECLRIAPAMLPADASGGRVLPAPDLMIGDTIVDAFELPPLDGGLADAPRLAIAAAGTGSGWRGAALLISGDDGATWSAIGGTALPAVIGKVVDPPGSAAAGLTDHINRIEVALAHEDMVLSDADDAALDAGANLAMIGDELVQFARAQPVGGGLWRLSGLWRGRRGTEHAIGTQASGDRFVLIAREALAIQDLPGIEAGARVRILAQGVGDAEAATASVFVTGISIAPPAPVQLMATELPDGTTEIRWVRRSRLGWRWMDGLEVPLGEEGERYRVAIGPEGAPERVVETNTPTVLLAAGDRGAPNRIRVQQIGTHALSRPAELWLPILGES